MTAQAERMRQHLDAAYRKLHDEHKVGNPGHLARLDGMADMIALIDGTNPTDEFNAATRRLRASLEVDE